MILEGGCLCGAVRYRIDGEPGDVVYCHCRMCQKQSGAPTTVWAEFPTDAVSLTNGAPASFRSSPMAMRHFCSRCGSPLFFRSAGRDAIDVAVGTLDDPDRLKPNRHIWDESRPCWFDVADDLPRGPKEFGSKRG